MKSTKKKSKQPITVDGLVEQASVALNKLQPELAASFYKRALELEPNNTNLMDAYADVLIQIGSMEEALALLTASTARAPEENPYKWMFLAQLQQGEEALASYTRGIDYAMKHIQTISDDVKLAESKKLIAKAYCSVAELYLTDLCYDEKAETNSEKAVSKALELVDGLLDARQTLASIRLSQSRVDDAAKIMGDVYHQVMGIRQKIHARTVIEDITATEMPEECIENPEFDFCVATAKLLIECGASDSTLVECAMELLANLLEEDDENIEVWYVTGVASLSLTPPDLESARYHLERAKEMMETLQKHCEEDGQDFPFCSEYDLLTEHFNILEEMERKRDSGEMMDTQEQHGRIFGQRRRQDHDRAMMSEMPLENEEEWSTCDEDDDIETDDT